MQNHRGALIGQTLDVSFATNRGHTASNRERNAQSMLWHSRFAKTLAVVDDHDLDAFGVVAQNNLTADASTGVLNRIAQSLNGGLANGIGNLAGNLKV
jgi:CBS-domain-containing membrane protein